MRTVACALCFIVLGCTFQEGVDARVPGSDLGVYRVEGALESNTCGPGALGAPDVWEFDVRLSRADPEFFWLNGSEVIPGTVDSTQTFRFDSLTKTELEPPRPGMLPCTILRTDSASGTLGGSGTDVPSFDARLAYAYAEGPETDCTPFLGVEGSFAELPCEMAYALSAVRTEEPLPPADGTESP